MQEKVNREVAALIGQMQIELIVARAQIEALQQENEALKAEVTPKPDA